MDSSPGNVVAEVENSFGDWLRLHRKYTVATAKSVHRSTQQLHDNANITPDDTRTFARYVARVMLYIENKYEGYRDIIAGVVEAGVSDPDRPNVEFTEAGKKPVGKPRDTLLSLNSLYTACNAARAYIEFRYAQSAPVLDRLAGKFSHLRSTATKTEFVYSLLKPDQALDVFKKKVWVKVCKSLVNVTDNFIVPFLHTRPVDGFSLGVGFVEVLPLVYALFSFEAPITSARFRGILQPWPLYVDQHQTAATVDQEFIDSFLPNNGDYRLLLDFDDHTRPRYFLAARYSRQTKDRRSTRVLTRIALHPIGYICSALIYFYLTYCRGPQTHEYAFARHGFSFRGGTLNPSDISSFHRQMGIPGGSWLRHLGISLIAQRFASKPAAMTRELLRVCRLFKVPIGTDTELIGTVEKNHFGQSVISKILDTGPVPPLAAPPLHWDDASCTVYDMLRGEMSTRILWGRNRHYDSPGKI